MFFDLNSLIFLNLNSLVETKDEDIIKRDLFKNINENVLLLCLDLENNPKIKSEIPDKILIDCKIICFSNKTKIDINFLCIDDCEKINKYYNYEQTSCIYRIPEGYFVNNTSLKTIDKCHPDCQKCQKKYDEKNSYFKSFLEDKF